MNKGRIRPMPTPEQKARARMEMTSADPFACALKSVDDKFPDSREKDAKTLKEEAEVEAMVRRIMAQKRMAAAAAAKKLESVTAPATAVSEAPKTGAPKAEVPQLEAPAPETDAVEAKETENPELQKAIENAFEGDDLETDDNFDDEYYDDIEQMEDGLYDDELDDEIEENESIDGGIMDEDMMKADMLDEDLINSELADDPVSETEIMDDFDDTQDVQDVQDAKEHQEEAPVSANGRPVNMVLGKKVEEPVKPVEPIESVDEGEMTVEVTPMDQDMKDKIRAKQMDFGADGVTQNPLIDNRKEEPAITPKSQVKLMGMESKQKKMMIGIIALAVLALGGILFGIVAMVKQGKTSEELAQQMAAVASTSSSSDTVDNEYIYIKDWSLKIKIIAGLTDVSYNVATDDFAEVMIWGAKKDSSVTYTPDFARQAKNSNPLGTVVRVARYERAAAGRLIWYDDYYNYYYQGPSGIPSVSESEMNWWVESYLLIKEMLTNADNYTSMEDTNTIGQQ